MAKKKSLIKVLKILRPHQWSKNLLVFLPIFLAQSFNFQNFQVGLICFIVFSLTASIVYLLNDIVVLKHDKKHRYKNFKYKLLHINFYIFCNFKFIYIAT